ncbi:MAG: response regulator, partial [Alcaligenaceae bacterium]
MPNSPVRILLLEDSDLDTELLQASLRRGDVKHDIVRVWSRADYERTLLAQPFDLVLADFVLPDFDGMSALAFAHEHRPDVPFIFVSGTLGEDVAIESFKRGATDYVIKQRLREVNASLEATVAERTKERDLVWRLSQDLFFLAERDGRLSSVNPAWTNLLGVEAIAAQGRLLEDLVDEAERPVVARVLTRFDQVTV